MFFFIYFFSNSKHEKGKKLLSASFQWQQNETNIYTMKHIELRIFLLIASFVWFVGKWVNLIKST